jgi:hypothetical protein
MSSVIERFDQLVGKLPTFTPIEVEDVRRFTNAGEWQLALDLLVATAIMRKRSLSQEIYAEICALALWPCEYHFRSTPLLNNHEADG